MTKYKDLPWLCLFLSLIFGVMLGTRPISVPDEGRYAEIPREMVVSQDYITPRLNGVKYFEKPILMYWLESISIKFFGLSEWSLRLFPAVLGMVGCLLIFIFMYSVMGRFEAWGSAVVLATFALYYTHTRLLVLDLGLTVFLSLSLLSYLRATQVSQSLQQRKWLIGFYTGSALAVLTKGIIGALIPGCIILIWTVPWKRWSALKLAFQPWGVILFFGLVGPWHILVSLKNPEFPYFYFIHEHFTRFTTTIHRRFQPWWFFLPIITIGVFPWLSFIKSAVSQSRQNFSREMSQFLNIWIIFILLFFSVSNSKLIPYILPVFPPIAIILGNYLGKKWQNSQQSLDFHNAIRGYQFLCIIILLVIPIILYTQDLLYIRELRAFFLVVGLNLILSIFLSHYFLAYNQVKKNLVVIITSSLILYQSINLAWPLLDDRSIKPLALTLIEQRDPKDLVICYESYYQDLPVYLNEIVKVVGWQNELEFGMKQEDTSGWMLTYKQFDKLWYNTQKVYVITPRISYENLKKAGYQMKIVNQTNRNILVSNF